MHPNKEELEEFEKAKKQCPFCKEKDTSVYAGAKDALLFTCCNRVLVCNDIGLFEETE